MNSFNQLTVEAVSILKCIYEDQLEDRLSYRNEIRRLSMNGLSLAFSNYEHFLDRYGYLTIDQRSDALSLTSSGIEIARGEDARTTSLNDDILYHFSKEIQEGIQRDSSSPILTGKRFDHHYIRFEGIGRGGLGSVWRAEHLKTGRRVAIKSLEGIDEVITSGRKSTLKKRLERVIRQVAQLEHPFISPILDLSVHHTPPYYVMPLYTGGSLRDLLRAGPISPEVGLNLFNQVCLGMQHAHAKGVLHLDLKPENILIDERGNIRLFDFGLSRTIAKQIAQVGRQSYVGFGSVAYMSPELMRDATLEAESVDIYSLGLLLYEILIGELPGRRSPMPSSLIEGLPAPIDELFDVMTQDQVTKRPQSMGDVLSILNKVQPFDRLSSQAMVMISHHATFAFPGLKSLDLPELEEAVDIQRENIQETPASDPKSPTLQRARAHRSGDPSGSSHGSVQAQQAKRASTQISATEPILSQAGRMSGTTESSHVNPSTATLENSNLESSTSESSKSESNTPEESQIAPTGPEEKNSLETTNNTQPASILVQTSVDQAVSDLIETPSHLPIEPQSAPASAAPEVLEVAYAESLDEQLLELEELEEEDELISSASPHLGHRMVHRMGHRAGQSAMSNQIIEEAERRLDEQFPEADDFDEDAATSLQPLVGRTEPTQGVQPNWPPRTTQTSEETSSTQPRRSSSMAQQLLERKRRDRH